MTAIQQKRTAHINKGLTNSRKQQIRQHLEDWTITKKGGGGERNANDEGSSASENSSQNSAEISLGSASETSSEFQSMSFFLTIDCDKRDLVFIYIYI